MINKKNILLLFISLTVICLTVSVVSATDENVVSDTQTTTEITKVVDNSITNDVMTNEKIKKTEHSVTNSKEASGSTYYVSTTGKSTNDGSKANPVDLTTAVNKVKREQGGNIIITAGNYPITSYLGLTTAGTYSVSGETGQTITLNGQDKSKIMWITDGVNVELKNIVFSNGKDAGVAGAIRKDGNGYLKITNCTFKNNNAANGGAIYSATNALEITNCNFDSNVATASGGAINNLGVNTKISNSIFTNNKATALGGAILNKADGLTISNSEFTQNSAKIGGSLYNDGGNSLTISKNKFTKDTATESSGSIYTKGTSKILENTFTGTNSKQAGTILVLQNTGTVISKNQFIKNSATDTGGVITNNGAKNTEISYNNFKENSAKSGMIVDYESSTGTSIKYNNFTKNTATLSGGAISISSISSSITNNLFEENKAANGSGAIYVEGNNLNIDNNIFKKQTTDGSGAAIFVRASNAKITNNEITDSYCHSGTIYLDRDGNSVLNNIIKNNKVKESGSAILINANANSIITGNTISNNQALSGGAVVSINTKKTTINNNKFINNSAKLGGAIVNNNGIGTTIQNNEFTSNTAQTNGGAIMVYKPSSQVTIKNNKFTSNVAAANAGAIMMDGNNNIISYNSFTSNVATNNLGGAISNYGTSTQIIYNNFTANKANYDKEAIRDNANAKKENNKNADTSKCSATIYNGGASSTISNNIFEDTVPVVKVATIVTVSPASATAEDNMTLTANIKGVDGTSVNGGTVVFKINGKTISDKISVKNGKVTATVVAVKGFNNGNITASYSGSTNYLANSTKTPAKATVNLREAKLTLTVTPTTQKQYETIQFTAKVTDSVTNKAPADNTKSYVIFKINGVTLKDSSNNVIRVKVNNGVATYNYVVPAGMAGYTADNQVRYYNASTSFFHPDYNTPARPIAKFTVQRSPVTITTTQLIANMTSKKLIIKGNIKDYKNNNVIGTSKLNVKINGVTLKINNANTVTLENGIINLVIDIPANVNNIKNITLVTGAKTAYEGYRTTITSFTRA
ncbi:MAG: hypothetical protein E7Z85_02585 [Methanosphaera stadtmanae]|nr:hypothetical protein [Methanosphaera stadtmanae]